jgi:glycosyltransferase involved in cell wall biosynthesis
MTVMNSVSPVWMRVLSLARQARTQPGNFEAANTAVQGLAILANDTTLAAPAMPAPATALDLAASPNVSIIICSINPARYAAITERYRNLFPADKLEIVGIHDARGLNEAYNRGLDRATGDIVVFSHDDLRILPDDFALRLAGHMQHFDVIGVAGTTRASGPAFGWSGHPHSHGWVTHPAPDGKGWMAGAFGLDFAVVSGAQMLDGLWFAARTEAARRIRFDEALTGFHFYDVDFTYRCHLAGLRIGICPDLLLVHESHGNFGEAWQQASAAVLTKHPALREPVGRFLHAYGGRVSDIEAVKRFYGWLAALAGELDKA